MSLQVQDNPALLDEMLADLKGAPELYRPGNYWANYEALFIPELRQFGLKDFRRRRSSILSSFGATDLLPATRARSRTSGSRAGGKSITVGSLKRDVLSLLLGAPPLTKGVETLAKLVTGASITDVQRLSFEYARLYGETHGARALADLDCSLAGAPEDVFHVGPHAYTMSMLYYYLFYAYCSRQVAFDDLGSVAEVGPGSGKQVEVLHKLHPHLCFYLFDIPPQLYVCEQFLSAVFPGAVVGYRETKKLDRLPEARPGAIYLMGTWKLAEMAGLQWDLFWNSASFQEMEAEMTLNYLACVNQATDRFVFLHEAMKGMIKAQKAGEHGVLRPTTLEHYEQGLSQFELLDLRPSIGFEFLTRWSEANRYECGIWKRTAAGNR